MPLPRGSPDPQAGPGPVLCSLGASWPFPSLGFSRASFYIICTILLLLYHKAVFPCGAGVGLILPTSGPGTVPHTWGGIHSGLDQGDTMKETRGARLGDGVKVDRFADVGMV